MKQKESGIKLKISNHRKVYYDTTDNLFPNPERGLYHHTETRSNRYVPLDLATLQRYRQNENITLILRLFYFDDFVTMDISHRYLNRMQTDFDTVRLAGLKTIVRFAYTDHLRYAPGTTWPPIPPYGDATKKRILRHLEQLRPVLRANSDVIAVMQAGFIGLWGEGYYTDHFIKDPTDPGKVTRRDWDNRGEVLAAILDVLPADRVVQVRTPLAKQRIYNRALPVTQMEAHTGSNIARVGYHNDSFLASETDYGTYRPEYIAEDKAFLSAETHYLPMGGETCAPNPPRSECPTTLEELRRFHWSFLNVNYHPDVLAKWGTDGCLDEIQRKLGYRFVLVEGIFMNEVRPGAAFTIDVKLRNDGWAAPFNLRPVRLLLRYMAYGAIYQVTLPNDPRSWLANSNTIYSLNHRISTPADMPTGNYEMLLDFSDADTSLCLRPEYDIRLANDMVWEDSTGYNKLLHTISVTESAPSSVYSGSLILKAQDKTPTEGFKVC